MKKILLLTENQIESLKEFDLIFETENGSKYYMKNGRTQRDKLSVTKRIEKWAMSDKTLFVETSQIVKIKAFSTPIVDLTWDEASLTLINDFGRQLTVNGLSNPQIGLHPIEITKGYDGGETINGRINVKTPSLSPYGVNYHLGNKITKIYEI